MQRLITTTTEGAVKAIAHGIDSALRRKLKVLWLLSGGSNIPLQIQILHALQHANRHNLTISLIDERFVPLDSPNSNWHALLDAGLTGERARLEPPIIDWSPALEDAAHDWALRLGKRIGQADMIVGQFGVGEDGHTAGILPHTPGVREHDKLVLGYKGSDFERLTTTPQLFKQLHVAVCVAMGESKKAVLQRMPTGISADEQPAQLLLSAPELIVYTDQQVDWPETWAGQNEQPGS